MPTVAVLDGVRIVFYANEHPPPHFHARSAEHHAVIEIETLSVTQGFLPNPKRKKVIAWASTRKDALRRAFAAAISKEQVGPIV